MADGGGDVVANFMAITGADDNIAIQMLEAANFVLEDAVNLFFAAEGNVGGDRGGGGGSGADAAASGGTGGGGGAGQLGGRGTDGSFEDGVRAPLPSKIERLYGDDFDPRAMYHYHGLSGRPPPQSSQVDVFRDFRAETAAAAAAQSSGAATSSDAAAAAGGAQGLSGLFKLPADLVFSGNAELAKARATAEGKWLLLNVQSATEFASHRLNRDTWSQEALKEVLKGTFVFYQTHENSADGRALIKAYRLGSQAGSSSPCPAILVVDPTTGAQLWQRSGFIDAEKLMEELVPFMDHGPLDAGAANLAQTNMKRKATASAAAAAAAPAAAATRVPMTEDEELALAIAMSMEREEAGAGASSGAGVAAMDEDGGPGSLDDLDEAAIWEQIKAAERQAAVDAAADVAASSKKSPEEVAAEALSRVPPEPAEGDPEAVRVALRMPDGARVTRRFRRTDPVRALFDLGMASVPEAAAGRRLIISHAAPGGQTLADPDQTLDAAGVAGAMLAIKLGD